MANCVGFMLCIIILPLCQCFQPISEPHDAEENVSTICFNNQMGAINTLVKCRTILWHCPTSQSHTHYKYIILYSEYI